MSIQPATRLTDTLEALVEEYRQWLAVERSLVPDTVRYRAGVARRFLSECGDDDLKSLSLEEVTGFLVNESSRLAGQDDQGLGHCPALGSGLSVPEGRDR